jgi:streptogramin lyase
MGLWLDRDARLYVAAHSGAAVIRLDPDGEASVVARSPEGWSPTGGMIGQDGSLWLLEYSGAGQVRVRRVALDGTERVF